MQNEGVVLRTPLRLEDAQHGVLVEPVCPEAVDGLGRDGDELAVSQQPGCGGNVLRTLRREHLCFHDLSLLSLRRSFSAWSAAMSASRIGSSPPFRIESS